MDDERRAGSGFRDAQRVSSVGWLLLRHGREGARMGLVTRFNSALAATRLRLLPNTRNLCEWQDNMHGLPLLRTLIAAFSYRHVNIVS